MCRPSTNVSDGLSDVTGQPRHWSQKEQRLPVLGSWGGRAKAPPVLGFRDVRNSLRRGCQGCCHLLPDMPLPRHPEGFPVGAESFLPFQRRSVLLVVIVVIRVGLRGVIVVIVVVLTEALLGCQLGGLLLLLAGQGRRGKPIYKDQSSPYARLTGQCCSHSALHCSQCPQTATKSPEREHCPQGPENLLLSRPPCSSTIVTC